MKQIRVITALAAMLAAGVTTQAIAQGRGRGEEKHQDQHQDQHQKPVPQQEQQRRIQQEQQRTTQYRQSTPQQIQQLQQRNAEIERNAQRTAQLRAQQDYMRRVQTQRAQIQPRDYEHDEYIRTPHTYRYVIQGAPRETNQYGVALLRQAVNYGYQEGFAAGRADRQDRYRFSYQNNPAYLDANYGYTGAYIDQPDYNYYFRQGFQRGYDDGFYSRFRYGSQVNGSASILGNVLTSILGLVTIH